MGLIDKKSCYAMWTLLLPVYLCCVITVINHVTDFFRYAIPDTPYSVPSTVEITDLVSLINTILQGTCINDRPSFLKSKAQEWKIAYLNKYFPEWIFSYVWFNHEFKERNVCPLLRGLWVWLVLWLQYGWLWPYYPYWLGCYYYYFDQQLSELSFNH